MKLAGLAVHLSGHADAHEFNWRASLGEARGTRTVPSALDKSRKHVPPGPALTRLRMGSALGRLPLSDQFFSAFLMTLGHDAGISATHARMEIPDAAARAWEWPLDQVTDALPI